MGLLEEDIISIRISRVHNKSLLVIGSLETRKMGFVSFISSRHRDSKYVTTYQYLDSEDEAWKWFIPEYRLGLIGIDYHALSIY